MAPEAPVTALLVDRSGIDALIAALAAAGYAVRGPVVRDGVVAAGDLASSDDLPVGRHDRQQPGHYELLEEGDDELFGWAVGPQSLKGEFFPSAFGLWRLGGEVAKAHFEAEPAPRTRAVVGARPCELSAIEILDRVLTGGAHPDGHYGARRRDSFIVVAECGAPGGVCFCDSMHAGPEVEEGFDLALTELGTRSPAGARGAHRFLVRAGSTAGTRLLGQLDGTAPTQDDWDERSAVLSGARRAMGRHLDTDGLAGALIAAADHPRWAEVAERCLACGNCTMVCPTCFCSDIHDVSDLAGQTTRTRRWSSCFEVDHSFLHGGAVRRSTASRYRQWATHKLATWQEQFGTPGCVGCGRCIAWCPVAIDLTEEARAIREPAPAPRDAGSPT